MSELTARFSETLKRSGLPPKPRPPSLYHYTTAGGFTGIVKSRNIRATNFSFMNDPSEVIHGHELMAKMLAEATAVHSNPVARTLFQQTLDRFRSEGVAEIYVSCFTAKKDDLSQWRAYGSSAARYALEFDTEKIHAATLVHHPAYNVRFAAVEYDQDKQHEHVQRILHAARHFIIEHKVPVESVEACSAILFQRLTRLLPTLKTGAYSVEDEWRIILRLRDEFVGKMQFDTSRGVIRSFVDFPISAGLLPLKSVLVLAPSRPKAAEKAARLVLNQAGLSSDVQYSTIPVADF